MIEFLISILQDDFRVAVLSRGYGRKSQGFVLADSKSSVEVLGDEPFQIYSKFPKIILAVDTNRQSGISRLEDTFKPDVILLDDAFQHRKVKPGFSILLTAYGNLYADDWYLPTGSLRDSKQEAQRADLIVVTKCPADIGNEDKEAIRLTLKLGSRQALAFSKLVYAPLLKGIAGDVSVEELRNRKITLVTGIANPEPLVVYLKDQGLIFEHLKFRDHHFFTESEFRLLREKECVITTEKDYVRLENELDNLYYIRVAHEFLNGSEEMIRGFLKEII